MKSLPELKKLRKGEYVSAIPKSSITNDENHKLFPEENPLASMAKGSKAMLELKLELRELIEELE